MGCGACAFVCPTCDCFDIVDEGDRAGGERRADWDSCGFALFTLHASGHNPRDTGPALPPADHAQVQVLPRKFGMIACVGCGRCIRACPVDMNISQCLKTHCSAKIVRSRRTMSRASIAECSDADNVEHLPPRT